MFILPLPSLSQIIAFLWLKVPLWESCPENLIEILFFDCPLIRNNYFNSGLKLYFVGNGSKVLNENLLSFGSEFNFIKEMSIIDEVSNECCNSALNFRSSLKKIQPYKAKISFENKGFFEKLFDYFTKK